MIAQATVVSYLLAKSTPKPVHAPRKPPPTHGSTLCTWTKSRKSFVTRFIISQRGPVSAVLKLIENWSPTKTSRLASFVVDMFYTAMVDVAHELGVPSYVFYPSSASSLGLFLYLQGLADFENRDLKEYKDSDEAISISIPTKFQETKGIIVNTFLELEPHAVRALVNLPSVYLVGPIIQYSNDDNKKLDEIMKWLDEKPDSSVVFLCFGSRGSFEADQEKFEFLGEFENVGEFLPDGFLERTSRVGKVIGWSPQVAVLAHRAVRGFVWHCMWNSTLESVWCGVPMAAWPLAAEQQANAFQLTTELGLLLRLRLQEG
ncbi:UDP-glycosyltransferase 71B2 [Striga hermonthica]|uniref:UDP-glycosyltransferase 71B2 n=1 Tax=Striga hermonthica TaxID=68872 RepID=A0A9N7R4K5_STRHE|nr:UDP-glycosyltransferase 71B2 [Striga hermonthica]